MIYSYSGVHQFRLLVLLFLTISLVACQNTPEKNDSAPETEAEADTIKTTKLSTFERLDQLDLANIKQASSYYSEAGDCGSQITRYEQAEWALVIDSLDCGDYGWGNTFYLLDDLDEIKMVHVKHTEPFVNYDTEQFYYALTEKIIDFCGDEPVMKARTDTLLQSSPETAVKFDENYQSDPWITVNAKGDDFVLGKKIDYAGEWYESSKKALKDSLAKMTVLPRQIPLQFIGEYSKGIRGEATGDNYTKEVLESIHNKPVIQNMTFYQ